MPQGGLREKRAAGGGEGGRGRREAWGTPSGGRCPACGGGLRETCGTPAGADAPRGRRAAWAAERPRGPAGPRPRVGGGLREACGTPARADAPRVRWPAWVAEPPRGPMPRVGGGLHGSRNACEDRCPACAAACGVPAERPRETDAPGAQRRGGRIQRPPKRLSSPLPGACRAAGPPGLRPAGTVRPRIRRHAR